MSIYVFIALIAIVAFLLVLIVMVQNPKGGGLDGSFGGSGSAMFGGGVKQTTDFLDKATWYLFGLLVVLVLLSNSVILKGSGSGESPVKQAIENHVPTADEVVPTKNPALDNTKPADNKVPEKK